MKIKIILFSLFSFLSASAASAATALHNPLGENVNNFEVLIHNAIKGILGLTGAVALVMIVIGGITWMTSAGNTDRIRRGKDTLLWAILGLLIIFLSYAIINFVFDALNNS